MTDDANALYNLGLACTRSHDWEAALEFFEQAATLAPEEIDAWQALGTTAHRLSMWETARAALTQAIALGREDGEIHGRLADALRHLKQPAAAARRAERALEFLPSLPIEAYLHEMVGYYWAKQGDEDAALHHYRAAVAADPESASAQHNLGGRYVRRNQFADAVPHLARAAELLSDFPGAWYDLGRAARRAGDAETARAAMERVLALSDDDPYTRLELAAALIALGRGKEAARHIRRALRFRLKRETRTWAFALLARCRT